MKKTILAAFLAVLPSFALGAITWASLTKPVRFRDMQEICFKPIVEFNPDGSFLRLQDFQASAPVCSDPDPAAVTGAERHCSSFSVKLTPTAGQKNFLRSSFEAVVAAAALASTGAD